MSSETNHSLLTDLLLERNEKIFHMPRDIATSKKFHSNDNLSVFSMQVLKEIDSILNCYPGPCWVQKQKCNLIFKAAWCTAQELTLGSPATRCPQLGDVSKLVVQKGHDFETYISERKIINVIVDVYL